MLIILKNDIKFNNTHEFIAYCVSEIIKRTNLTQRELKKNIKGYNSYQKYIEKFKDAEKPKSNYTSLDETVIISKQLNSTDKFLYFLIRFYSYGSSYSSIYSDQLLNSFNIKLSKKQLQRSLKKLSGLGFIKYSRNVNIIDVKMLKISNKESIDRKLPTKKNNTKVLTKNNKKDNIKTKEVVDMIIDKTKLEEKQYELIKKALKKSIKETNNTFIGVENLMSLLIQTGKEFYLLGVSEDVIDSIESWLDVEKLEKFYIPEFTGIAKTPKAKKYKESLIEASIWFSKSALKNIYLGYIDCEPKLTVTSKNVNKKIEKEKTKYLQDDDGFLTQDGEEWLEKTTFLVKNKGPDPAAVEYAKKQQAYWRSIIGIEFDD